MVNQLQRLNQFSNQTKKRSWRELQLTQSTTQGIFQACQKALPYMCISDPFLTNTIQATDITIYTCIEELNYLIQLLFALVCSISRFFRRFMFLLHEK